MDKAERSELLRARFKNLFPFSAKPLPPTKRTRRAWTPSRPAVPDDNHGAAVYGRADNHHDWIWEKPRAKKVKLSHKRGAKKSALVKIAEKAPKKLIRTYRNAESLLAARARR